MSTLSNRKSGLATSYPTLTIKDLDACMEQGKTEMYGRVFMVTPDMASHILVKHNTRNRRVSQPSVDKWSKAMAEGKWLVHSDGVSFSHTRLNNGQHRLHGVVKAGIPVPLFMAFGESEDAFKVKDTGRVRSKADLFFIAYGDANAGVVAGMARVLLTLDQHAANPAIDPRGKKSYSDDELLAKRDAMADDITLMKMAVSYGTKMRTPFSISGPGASAAFMAIREKTKYGEAKVTQFFDQLIDGTGLGRDDPRYVLRKQFTSHHSKTARKLASGMFSNCKHSQPIETAALLVLAWNAFSGGQSRKHDFDWTVNAPFPVIR